VGDRESSSWATPNRLKKKKNPLPPPGVSFTVVAALEEKPVGVRDEPEGTKGSRSDAAKERVDATISQKKGAKKKKERDARRLAHPQ